MKEQNEDKELIEAEGCRQTLFYWQKTIQKVESRTQ